MGRTSSAAVQRFLGGVRGELLDRREAELDEVWQDGYAAAAEDCMEVLDKRIVELEQGLGKLSSADQLQLAKIRDLRRELESVLGTR